MPVISLSTLSSIILLNRKTESRKMRMQTTATMAIDLSRLSLERVSETGTRKSLQLSGYVVKQSHTAEAATSPWSTPRTSSLLM